MFNTHEMRAKFRDAATCVRDVGDNVERQSHPLDNRNSLHSQRDRGVTTY